MLLIVVVALILLESQFIHSFQPKFHYQKNRCVKDISLKLFSTPESIILYETRTKPFLNKLYLWLSEETLASLLPKDDSLNIIRDFRSSEGAMQALYLQYNNSWDKFFDQVTEEKRSVREILGNELSLRLLASVESTDIYDPATVQTFLQNPVFESMLGSILYEGIFEFLQRVDILGNIVNNLPIIGPIRVAIIKEFKLSLDRTVGSQIKVFLSSFNKIAVQRMVDFVLSPQNRKSFSVANRNVLDALISKPLNTLLPSGVKENPLKKVKADLWLAIQDTPISEIEVLLDSIYDKVGADRIGSVVDVDMERALLSIPTAGEVVHNNLIRLLKSDIGKKAFEDLECIKEASTSALV